jgi:hypothetical protein
VKAGSAFFKENKNAKTAPAGFLSCHYQRKYKMAGTNVWMGNSKN